MDIERYLEEKQKRLEKGARRLRDLRVFDFTYIPAQPLMRDELKPVIDALLRYERTGIANHLLIVGSRGCGKTLSLLYLRRMFRERGVNVLYANCRTHNTSYKILAHLIGVRARGASFSELAERFKGRYIEKTVVVLDEVDLLSPKDVNKDVLYFLSRAPCNYMAILLSNNPKWSGTLDESTQSTLQPELIYFRPYTASELGRILKARATSGLKNTRDSIVREIAAMTAKYANSDVRVALKTLYYWAVEPQISLEDNFQRARRDIVVDVVSNLSHRNLLVLKSAIGEEKPVKTIYARYRDLCRGQKEEPFSYVYFYSCLSYLQSLGLVLLISTKIRRTYTKLIQVTFPPEILNTIWALRFG